MLTLGIETSCDETACAVVKDGREILSNAIASQIKMHRKTGGVVPEVAAREHVVKITPVLDEALSKAKLKLEDIDVIAVTAGPGLLSSLLIGVNSAMTLAMVLKKPLVPINHIEGHIYANWLTDDQKSPAPKFPAAILTVSGGHNELFIWKNHGEYQFLGATLDDAAGEAFDKVARLLGLPYPGGPEIQKAAEKGEAKRYPLPRAWLPEQPWNFSFSGLKSAVLRLVKEHKMTPIFASDVAASFQDAVCDVLAKKTVNAAIKFKVKEIQLAGGVSANKKLREYVQNYIDKINTPRPSLRFCEKIPLCTDNAAMIAAAGHFKFKKNPAKYKKWRPIIADPNLEIDPW